MAHCNAGCRALQYPAPFQHGESSGYLGRGAASRAISETAAGKVAWVMYVHLGQGVGMPQATSQLCSWTNPAHLSQPLLLSLWMCLTEGKRATGSPSWTGNSHKNCCLQDLETWRQQGPWGEAACACKKKKEHHGNVSIYILSSGFCSCSIQVAGLWLISRTSISREFHSIPNGSTSTLGLQEHRCLLCCTAGELLMQDEAWAQKSQHSSNSVLSSLCQIHQTPYSSPQLVSLFPHTSFLRFKLEQLHKHITFPAAGTLASTPQLTLQPLLCKVQLLSHVHSAHSAEQHTVHLPWNFVFNLITQHCYFTSIVASLCPSILEHHF